MARSRCSGNPCRLASSFHTWSGDTPDAFHNTARNREGRRFPRPTSWDWHEWLQSQPRSLLHRLSGQFWHALVEQFRRSRIATLTGQKLFMPVANGIKHGVQNVIFSVGHQPLPWPVRPLPVAPCKCQNEKYSPPKQRSHHPVPHLQSSGPRSQHRLRQ